MTGRDSGSFQVALPATRLAALAGVALLLPCGSAVAGNLGNTVRAARARHVAAVETWAQAMNRSPADFLVPADPDAARRIEEETAAFLEDRPSGTGIRIRIPVEGFLPPPGFDVPRLSPDQEAVVAAIAHEVTGLSQASGRLVVRVRGSSDPSACVGTCRDDLVLGRTTEAVAQTWIARSRATAVASRLRALLPAAIVEEALDTDSFPYPGVEFRRAVIEVEVLPSGTAAGCSDVCDAFGQRVFPEARTRPVAVALLAVAGAGCLRSRFFGTVEAGLSIFQPDLAFRLSAGGLIGPGRTRLGYVMRARVLLPRLLSARGDWTIGAGFAAYTTGEGLDPEPGSTRQHYIGEIAGGWRFWRSDRLALWLEATGGAGLGRTGVGVIEGTRVVERHRNEFDFGGTLGLAVFVE